MTSSLPRSETRIGLFLVAPAAIGLLIFNFFPVLQSGFFSLLALDAGTQWWEARFVGLRNYSDVMRNGLFWYTLFFTVAFTVAAVTLDLTLGMALALATFYVPRRVRGVLRAIIIVPWAIPKVIQATMWRWMLNSDVGPVGDMLVRLGLADEPPLFLVDRFLAMGSVLLAYTWKGSSIAAFFLMGGLAMIPRDTIESARVDGANAFQRFCRIVLPMVMPTIYVALLYRSQDALRVFDVIYGLTGGGPGTTTDTLSSFAYTTYFRYAQFGRASTYAVVTFLLVAAVGTFYIARIKTNFNFREP